MDRHGIRYTFEHRLLPQWFFEDKERFVELLLKNKGILFDILNDIFQKEKVKNPYTPEQFDIEPARLTDELMMVKIIFPEPEEEPLCYCCYLFFDLTFENPAFFCIEKGNAHSDHRPFVCSCTKEGVHRNHGNCTFEDHNDFSRCAEVFMGAKKE